jgi:hypothetical protein
MQIPLASSIPPATVTVPEIQPMTTRLALALALLAVTPCGAVTISSGTVNGVSADIWTWTDSKGNPRTVALKQEGNGNPGHGGYAIQMTYTVKTKGKQRLVTVNAEQGSDGGFGYFVSHERYRSFADGAVDTIASHIFNKDDSPLGSGFAAATSMPAAPAGAGAERFTIQYGHYGTVTPDPVNPNTGTDSTPLPQGASHYAFYTLPATTTWVFQDGTDYPRIDVSLALGAVPSADLVSFDMRGPYGVMVFDDGIDGTVNAVLWGDQAYLFALTQTPVTRDSNWDWSAANKGARYQALTAGAYEMGLFEPEKVAASATVDGYSPERGFTSASYAAAGGVSYSSCPSGAAQTLPSDGEWPYQSVQYSLPCGNGQFGTPTTGKKIAWGTTAYYGTSLTGVFDGQKSFPFNGFPASQKVGYSVCLVLGAPAKGKSLTAAAAATFAKAKPKSDCAAAAIE